MLVYWSALNNPMINIISKVSTTFLFWYSIILLCVLIFFFSAIYLCICICRNCQHKKNNRWFDVLEFLQKAVGGFLHKQLNARKTCASEILTAGIYVASVILELISCTRKLNSSCFLDLLICVKAKKNRA